MVDPQKKARDADRDAAIEVVEAAFADGQISRPDYDLRVDRLLRAATIGELQMLVRDLRRSEDDEVTEAVEQVTEDVPAAPARATPRPNLTAVKIVLAAAAAVLALGLVVPLVIVGRGESTGGGSMSAGSVEPVRTINLTTAKGYNRLGKEVEAKTGSTVVFSAVVYPGYAVIEVPVDEQSQRSYGWYFDGDWDEWTGKGTADEERFDLDEINGRTLAALVKEARGLVEDPNTSYVIVNAAGRPDGVCMSAYASNEYGETAYLDARCDGTVVRTYVS
ncbi:DUF1707 SHOCT-like domain-containing protein [Nocardioides sp.]|uniref:DUF1707 SHOCT-like domain-containing protein n=1 Tax=Nocardioides sp. TaxID=35761 RepID=UPI002ED48FBA